MEFWGGYCIAWAGMSIDTLGIVGAVTVSESHRHGLFIDLETSARDSHPHLDKAQE